MKLLSRKDAKLKGSKFYFTGKQCKNKHLSVRYTSVATCKTCKEDKRVVYYSENRETILQKDKLYRKYKKKPNSSHRKMCLRLTR